MSLAGLALASRYAYPPNSLSLCGPEKQKDLAWYAEKQTPDRGNAEILSQFGTLYPYLVLIAGHNHIADPFDTRVVEAYWIGNPLLSRIPHTDYINFLDQHMKLSRKMATKEMHPVYDKIVTGALPNHAFHVLNIYKRTGHLDLPHTLETMDACLINWGKILSITQKNVIVETQKLEKIGDRIQFVSPFNRRLSFEGTHDSVSAELRAGDWISYHWGYICQKLSSFQLKKLKKYTELALIFANKLGNK